MISLAQRVTRFRLWGRRVGLARKLAVALTLAVIASGLTTFGALTRSGPLGPDPH
ncbi:MAG TPA: hypothetical protein HPQ04_15980, partial [Rhodospirillaceae bacterium]|nr:hypothetical protein [Rhodospirillaceae bacterium]